MNRISCCLLAATLVVLTSTLVVRAIADDKGELWETTSQMSMEGMPMQLPATTLKVCSVKEWKEPPGAADKQRNCKNLNMKTVGTKVTWDVQCTGPAMTGVGEITRNGTDSYTGSIKFTSAQGNMNIRLAGHKIGDCDNPQ
jgi:uncharacterized protein DUF3617